MYAHPEAHRALAAVDLRQGLALDEVHTRLEQGLRLHDTGQRILAFYLTEDEIHAVALPVLEALYQAMAERRIALPLQTGARTSVVHLSLPPFTLLAATTDEGALPQALRSRFGIREPLGYYANADLAALATHAARGQHVVLTPGAAGRLAASARGTPRVALRLLDRVLDRAASRGQSIVDRAAVQGALDLLGYDREGLDPSEQRYLALLRESRSRFRSGA